MISHDVDIRLNKLAQGSEPMGNGIDWFTALGVSEKREILRHLAAVAQQAGARPDDVPAAVAAAHLKTTHTPSVLLSRGKLSEQFAKCWQLPEAELARTFSLFVTLLGIADQRRRETKCAGGCDHWWHNL